MGGGPPQAGALVLHGLTGTPQSVEGLGRAFAAAGFAVRMPLLPGHGTTVEEMETTGWSDWAASVEDAYADLARVSPRVIVAGLSMGGSLACLLAAEHSDEVAGVVAVNPFIDPPAESFREALRSALDAGITQAPSIGGDLVDRSAAEVGYDALPIAPLLSLCDGLDRLWRRLPEIRCPLLLMTSRIDHVVPPVSSDLLAERVSGPVERVWLERSYHLATLDHDRTEVEQRAVEFATKITAG